MGGTTYCADDIPRVMDEEECRFWQGFAQEYDGKVPAVSAPATFAGAKLHSEGWKQPHWQQQQQQQQQQRKDTMFFHIGATEAFITVPAAAAAGVAIVGCTAPSIAAAADPGTEATAAPPQVPVEPSQQRRSSVSGLMQAPPA